MRAGQGGRPPVQGDDGLWWPVEVDTATGAYTYTKDADALWITERNRDLPPDINPWSLPGIYLAIGTLGFAFVVEGIARYRINLDADERRRIQIVVYTGVPAVFAYALKVGIPGVLGLLVAPVMPSSTKPERISSTRSPVLIA